MGERKISSRGMPYLTATLKRKARVVTEAAMWGIKHRSGKEETALKLGRYKSDGEKKLESETPKSELTLDPEELEALLVFLRDNLDPFQAGARRWIALDEDLCWSGVVGSSFAATLSDDKSGVGASPKISILAAGQSSLSYDATSDQYTYVWKTKKVWADICRELVVGLNDGTVHSANFEFK